MSLFIAIEGIDGAGKTTQVRLLRDALVGLKWEVVTSREPTDGKWGTILRQSAISGRLSPKEELDMFVKDRAEHVENLILPSLAAGKAVILDRYFYSTIAYQGSRGADALAVQSRMEDLFPLPDAVLILDVDPDAGVHRIASSRGETPNEFEKKSDLERARQIFLAMQGPNIFHLDASGNPQRVHQEIMTLLQTTLREKR